MFVLISGLSFALLAVGFSEYFLLLSCCLLYYFYDYFKKKLSKVFDCLNLK